MEQWQLVIAGGLIGILANPLTEITRHWLGKRRDREDRRRDFQLEMLMGLAENLTEAEIAVLLVFSAPWEKRFPKTGETKHYVAFRENAIKARRHAIFVSDSQVRKLTQDALEAAADAAMIENDTELEAASGDIYRLFANAINRIGKLAREL